MRFVAAFSTGEHFLKQLGVIRFHHFFEQVLNGAALVRQHAGEVIEGCRPLLSVASHNAAMQDSPAEHGESRFAPVVFKPLAVGIDQHCGHILNIRYRHHGVDAEFFQGIETGRSAGRVRGIETQNHLILRLAPPGS